MVVASDSVRRAREGDAGGWGRPVVAGVVAALVLAALAFLINTAIENYRDEVALKGLDGKPSPIDLTVNGQPMTIPANMIRFRSERRGGAVDQVDLMLHWPSLEGFSDDRADAFKDATQDAPILFVSIAPGDGPLDSTARLDTVYSRFFQGPVLPGPAGLVGRALTEDSGYGGEVVYFQPRGPSPFVARCLAAATPEIPATCLREVNLGQGLSMLYRFNKARLGEWSRLDSSLFALVDGFLKKKA